MNWWIQRQKKDVYVRKRDQAGYRSRAAFKLTEILDKQKWKIPSGAVVDLGSAPGSWTQVLVERFPNRAVVACDLLEMTPIPGCLFFQGDFTDQEICKTILNAMHGQKAALICSDMAPNFCGNRTIGSARMEYLADAVLNFAIETIQPKGVVVMKIFQGESFASIMKSWKDHFQIVKTYKPDASRTESSEIYLLASSKRMQE
ncbi:MAG: RlmE family RNA methyltransferase [Gammaproteobacteria bacterium]|nr:RlmE family RNA methyltransferase [Gammaproteobacteria bacterium]